jgi:hypothetical protein
LPVAQPRPAGPAVVHLASGGLGALVPAWLVVFASCLGIALGYCLRFALH